MADSPNSFRDPYWSDLASKAAQKNGVPAGLLVSVLTNGERSNSDQVSEAGAKTVFQITPKTRELVLKRDGIDAYLSDENAADVAARVLKDGLNWAKNKEGDQSALAAGYYHAGGDFTNWGARTKAYVQRVSGGLPAAPAPAPAPAGAPLAPGESTFDRVMGSMSKPKESAMAAVLNAYQSGKMSPEDEKAFESEVNAGRVMLPRGVSLKTEPASLAIDLPPAVLAAYKSGRMTPEDKAGVDAAVKAGTVRMPDGAESIPGQAPGVAPAPDGSIPAAGPAPTIGQRIVGAGEAALNVGTGLTGGTVGMVGGTAAGMADAILSGQFGTPEAARMIEQRAAKGGEALTYAPRTASGQSQAAVIGEGLQAAVPVMPLAGEIAGVARAASTLKPTAQAVPAIARNTVGAAAEAVAERAGSVRDTLSGQVNSLLGREAPKPTPGTMGSAGAAGVDMATQRRMAAQELPVPIDLTEGQATRNFSQQRFEQETAKSPTAGEPLRERFAEQRQNFARNFDAMIDQTGAMEPTLRGAGIAVDSALKADVAKWKTEIRAKYAEAKKAGETAAPVDSGGIIDALNRMTSAESTAPVISAAKAEIQRLGGATKDGNGGLVAGQLSVDSAEQLRKFVGSVTGHDPVNQKFAGDIKRAIDATTENAGGDLYRAARRAREQYARRFEDNAVIKQLLSEKRGTADRQVAIEDVFKKSILDGSLDDVRTVRKVLQTAGEEGRQAWKELQGQAVNHIREQAMKSAVKDDRGNVVISADAINRVITSLERDGKLDFVFGKKGAETMRTLNDVAKHVYTSPPGTVNTSNTASVLLAALDMGISGASGMPLPVTSGLRMVVNNVKDRRIRARVAQALGKTEQRAKVRASAERAAAAKKKQTIH